MVINGKPGIGKSYAGLTLCDSYARKSGVPFEIGNVVFKITDFLDRVQDLPQYSTILFDDAGVEYSSAEWYSNAVKTIGKTLQSYRYKVINTIFTVPDMDFIPKQARDLLDLRIDMQQRGRAKAYTIQKARFSTKKIYTHTWGYLSFHLPPKEIIKPYEAKKDAFLTEKWAMERLKHNAEEDDLRASLIRGIPDDQLIEAILKSPSQYIKANKKALDVHLIMYNLKIRDIQRAYRLKAVIEKFHPELLKATSTNEYTD